jgi:glycerol-3-phosphate dehydrogenase
MLKAMNLVTRRAGGDVALGGRAPSGRNLFMVPWRGKALFGTWESAQPCDPADTSVAGGDVASFIGEINGAFPTVGLTPEDVTLVHRGVVPARVDETGHATLLGTERIHDHAAEGIDGLVTVVGTKYTTARRVAARVVDSLLRNLQHPHVPCRTASTPLPGGDILTAESATDHGPDEANPQKRETSEHLVAAYGSRYHHVLALCDSRPEWRRRIAEQSPVIGAELVWAARHEMAMTLEDAVVRRTPLGALGYPGDVAVERAAAIVSAELGWADDRTRAETEGLKRFYGSVNALKT